MTKCKRIRTNGPTPCLMCPGECVGALVDLYNVSADDALRATRKEPLTEHEFAGLQNYHVFLPPSHPFWRIFNEPQLQRMFNVKYVHKMKRIPLASDTKL